MNKIGVPRRDGFSQQLPAPMRGQRSPPKAIKLLLPVWGEGYVLDFLEFCLPTLLSPGNIPALASALPTEFVILTGTDDKSIIQEHPAFKRLAEYCEISIRPIDHLITDGNYSTTITLAYTEVVREAGPTMVDTCFFFLVSDYVVADGSLANALAHVRLGVSAVVVGNFHVVREDALPWLRQKLAARTPALVLQPRELMCWALNHLHQATLASTVNVSLRRNPHVNRLFWRVDGNTIIGRFYLMHMLCIRPEVTDFIIGASCDYSFVPEMCPSGNVEVIVDSDQYLVVEMQPRDREASFLRPGPFKVREIASSLSEWTTSMHRDNARHCVVFHGGELPPGLADSGRASNDFVADVARHLKPSPMPFRGHPYWQGAMAAFRENGGQTRFAEEWQYALGSQQTSGSLQNWLKWRAKFAILGKPPQVLPWQPSWPDFHAVWREIDPYFRDQTARMLMLSTKPMPFNLAFRASGERVVRLRRHQLQKSYSQYSELKLGKFDVCLVEIDASEMADGGRLVDQIVPFMTTGGRIVISIFNRHAEDTADEFGANITRRYSRFIRYGTSLVLINFVPSNWARRWSRRGISKLRTLLNRSKWIGVPIVILGAGVLLTLSLIGNLMTLCVTRSSTDRGRKSSFVMRLVVDASLIENETA
jgi:hypothetical protein